VGEPICNRNRRGDYIAQRGKLADRSRVEMVYVQLRSRTRPRFGWFEKTKPRSIEDRTDSLGGRTARTPLCGQNLNCWMMAAPFVLNLYSTENSPSIPRIESGAIQK